MGAGGAGGGRQLHLRPQPGGARRRHRGGVRQHGERRQQLFVRNATTSAGSAALVNAHGSNTSVVNHYNGFFGNTGGHYLQTYLRGSDLGPDPRPVLRGSCCPAPGSWAINAGIPDFHFNDPNGSRNDMGACGGPALATYGPMK